MVLLQIDVLKEDLVKKKANPMKNKICPYLKLFKIKVGQSDFWKKNQIVKSGG